MNAQRRAFGQRDDRFERFHRRLRRFEFASGKLEHR